MGLGDDRQSATARRSGSGGFLAAEDLNLETPRPSPLPPRRPTPLVVGPNWSLELPGLLLEGLLTKAEDMGVLSAPSEQGNQIQSCNARGQSVFVGCGVGEIPRS